ncbi:DUF6636 domain-containing protein [Kineosporia sp. A_224]|uniref:DUF6636 domain-containing protein n=1 Tax=Kineosporia sp. A_224 TaxID=1962180 RepID=UPI000B4A9158|nr:DUF6636 domain-containing protein [Kineosporia sp. A_224]
MRMSGVRVAVLSVTAALLLASCSVLGSDDDTEATVGPAPIGTVGVAPGSATVAPDDGTATDDDTPSDDAQASDDATDDPADDPAEDPADDPSIGPVQRGDVDPDDPLGVAKAFGVTLVDPVDAGMAQFGQIGFRSPSGRILCAVRDSDGADPGSARCDVIDNTWKNPPKPADCELDWGSSVEVTQGAGKARFACVGDVATDGPVALGYGKAVLAGSILCISRTTGVECLTVDGSNHGFRVSRAAYKLY